MYSFDRRRDTLREREREEEGEDDDDEKSNRER